MKIPRIPSNIALGIAGVFLAGMAISIVGSVLYHGGIWQFITLIVAAVAAAYVSWCAFPEEDQ